MTVWKQACVLGGAVLLLAACDRATGPSTQLQRAPVTKSFIDGIDGISSDTTTIQDLDPCRSGYNVSIGRLEISMSAECIDGMVLDQ